MPYVQERSIGSSDVGAILGVNPYRSAAQVWDDIMSTGGVRPGTSPGDGDTDRGHVMEGVILDLYARKHACTIWPIARLRHPTIPFIHSSPDAEIRARDLATSKGAEVKAPGWYVLKDFMENGVPPTYYAQCQHHMMCAPMWDEVVFMALDYNEWELWEVPIPRNPEFIAETEAYLQQWWAKYVEGCERPEDKTAQADEVRWPQARLGVTETLRIETLGPVEQRAWADALRELRNARNEAQMWKKAQENAEDRVKALMGDHPKVSMAGVGKISWENGTRRTFDKDALARIRPIDPNKLALWLTAQQVNGTFTQPSWDDLTLDLNQFYETKETRTFRPTFE